LTVHGRVAIVTGGASGIGLATVRELLRRGARVGVLDLADAGLDGPDVWFGRCDMTGQASVDAAVVARFGGLDVLVNNAGIGAVGTVVDNNDDEWRGVLDVNVLGIVRLVRAALPHLRSSSSAAVVNTCSMAATAGLVDRALYCASKGAVEALTRAMAADHLADEASSFITGTALAVDGGASGTRVFR
jgi:2-keto-3-deoxy-L-fuconate dehydrogenase